MLGQNFTRDESDEGIKDSQLEPIDGIHGIPQDGFESIN